MLFADDLQIYLSGPPKELDATNARINVDVLAVSDWARKSGPLLSVLKTQAMIVASDQRRMLLHGPFVPIILDGVFVSYENKISNLGLMIKSNLSWDSQISAISTRVHGVLHRLRARSRVLSTGVRRLLASALVLLNFDYAYIVFPVLTDELETKLRRLLNTAIRFVFDLHRDARMLPYQRTLGWLTPSSRRNYFVAVQAHRVLRQGRLAYLQDMLTRRPPMDRALRSSARDVLSVPFADKETYKRGFVVRGFTLLE
uniref:Reverse transcriptase domain-containing protein n=1 Tax=Trichogramma kaykai TaxID=54128 RepID=A0ABD2X0U1_9HYME